jgi:hypothetical protein
MRTTLLASACALFLLWTGTGSAQPPPGLQQAMIQARGITQDLGEMLLSEHLTDPTRVRDMAEVTNLLTFALRDMAVMAEFGTLSDAQRAQLTTTLDTARLMLDQMQQSILEERLQRP